MPSTSEVRAVLTAAGSGSRLGCEGPKALVELSGRPLVWWAARGLRAGGVGAIVVTAPASSIEEFRSALADVDGVSVVAGSDRSRQESVALGLAALGECEADTIVLVHDAARPLTPPRVTERVIDAVRGGAGAVIPVLPVTDTLKTVDASGVVTGTPRRSDMVAVQTPQGFRWDVLTRAHEAGASLGAEEARAATDDAGLVEASAQRESLGQLSDAQPVGASLEGRERDGDKPVPVGVRLDGGELEGVRGCSPQDTQVVLDGGQVDDRARRVCPSAALNVCDSHSPSISRESDRAAPPKPAASDVLRPAVGQDRGNRGHNVAGLNGGAAVVSIRSAVGRAGVQTHGCR